MDKIAVIKKRLSEKEWAEKISDCQSSGLSVADWCSANGINPKTYYYHLRKIREVICEQIPVEVNLPSVRAEVQTFDNTIKVRVSGAVVEIPDGVSENTLASVIRVLKNA